MSRCMSMNSRKLSGKLPSEDVPETSEHDKPEDDGEIVHFSHPEHRLARFDFPYLFMCMGCKEYGAGRRFMCQTCGFQLHEFCALAPPSLHDHPFHPKHQHLLFFVKPGGFLRCKCDICGKSVKGFSFRCASCSFDMHPCCAAMTRRMELPVHEHPLLLAPALEGSETSFVCQVCRRTKRSGHVYQCLPCGYYLHAKCSKDMVNGLYVHGIVPPEKRNALATAAKVTVNALFEVIGGLIEGIGEGIGEAFVENIGRSRRSFR
ncbi:protein VACUOLELESS GAMETOPHYTES-like [Phragmites australis]|uniref:protein VACUOLELESS GAMETOPHYTES-like n=1 Tax=Phragmites australis TaxID=29695 RepID=UPI002D796651|nr:protein VACUOLELESS GAMETOPHYTES-like [Phragmites australis]